MKFKVLVLTALLLGLAACEKKDEAQTRTSLETDDDRFSYGLGMVIGERVLKQYGDVDYDLLLQGIKAQHKDQETLMSLDDAGEALNAQLEKAFSEQSEANKMRGQDYLKANAEKEGVQVTASGLQYLEITAGDGPKPTATDEVTVHYRGTLIDGTEFDSSYSRGSPATFPLNQVIPGWTEGVQLMSVGSKFQFVIPYELGYGERGAGGSIGPFETLVFEVELLEIKP
ncbi:MAG: FKBP-type peptidyl-prolyl cis-trans isomerase [Gammaproteobacteria bacterium]|nr:FKBP-type peptidyl-prolyl cis-trans isomerase [Gammaproteobacteria bacterium]MDH3856616.1 FKBP-type peptidyl-prolyl cis-trans isomerase [Gammaproteobacteria bacterium]